MGRGYLPNNTWLQSALTTNVNINSTCNAFWDGRTVNFYKGGGGCRNTGEIAAVFDHEWAHGLDYNDGNGYSNPSESYADIAAIYRLQTSCVGYGFFQTFDRGCGQTVDGTGNNANLSQTGGYRCALDCSGVRDVDWDKLTSPTHTPDTPANFACTQCGVGSGPCGREVHCESAVDGEAAWDFAVRDLQNAPFNYDSNTAFIIANKIFYQGSGNIGNWHTCSCAASTSNGCGATNAYMQWLAADDDDGDISNGTPHMTALYNAFNRHGIACDTPTPVNSGCAGAPAAAPAVTATFTSNQVGLTWNTVAGATKYWVFRTEGYAGCDFGKTLIATVDGSGNTTYTDTGLANDRPYCYSVMAVGSSDSCFGSASTCVCETPVLGPHGTLQGTVTSSATGNPISGSVVKVGDYPEKKTNDAGFYTITDILVGTYPATASAYGYQTSSPITVQISDGTITTQDFSLNPAPPASVQGTVTDSSGHGWPLYARIDITASGYSTTVYTDPVTGSYSIGLYQGLTYTFTVSAAGYGTATGNLTFNSEQNTQDYALTISSCATPGYRGGLFEQFESSTAPVGWTIRDNAGTGAVWRFTKPGQRSNNTGGSGSFAIADSDSAGLVDMDTELISPSLDFTGITSVPLEFDTDFYYYPVSPVEVADVDVSNDGGATWTNVWRKTGANYGGPKHEVLDISSIAGGRSGIVVRFHYYNAHWDWWWQIDNVKVGSPVCSLVTGGGLVLGNVYDATTGAGLNTAQVTDGAGHTANAKQDPGLGDGFYTLFVQAGNPSLFASNIGYRSDSMPVTVVDGSITRQNFYLLKADPDVEMVAIAGNPTQVQSGATLTISDTVRNNGPGVATNSNVAFYLVTSNNAYTSIGGRNISYLSPGGSSTGTTVVTIPANMPFGLYSLCAQVNTDKDTNTNNNWLCSNTQNEITGPDLLMTAVSGPTSGVTGGSYTVSNTVKNNGGGQAGGFFVGIYLSTDSVCTTSDTWIGSRYVSGVAAGASSSENTPVSIPTGQALGTYYICAIADYNNSVVELNESNNSLTGNQIVISSGADLTPTAVSGPTSGVTGGNYTVSNTVNNIGSAQTGSFFVGIYLSTDSVCTTSDTRIGSRYVSSGVAAGASSSDNTPVSIPTGQALGTYYICVIADYNNNVVELNESNNSLTGNQIIVTH